MSGAGAAAAVRRPAVVVDRWLDTRKISRNISNKRLNHVHRTSVCVRPTGGGRPMHSNRDRRMNPGRQRRMCRLAGYATLVRPTPIEERDGPRCGTANPEEELA
jgi:hypothetical protein